AGWVGGGWGGGRRGEVRDVGGEVGGHEVHAVGEVLPGAAHPRDLRLTAQLSVGAHLARHTGHLGGEGVELVHHGVDGVLELEDLPADVHGDLLGEVAAGHGGGDLGDVANLRGEGGGHVVHGVGWGRRGGGEERGRDHAAARRCPPRGPRGSPPRRRTGAGPPSC